MGLSYSFHISSKGNAVSSIQNLKQISKHNTRAYQQSKHYNKDLVYKLIGSDNIYRDVKEVYEREFNDAVRAYNDKQKRSDRKIDNYFNKVSQSRNDVAVECIIQIGDRAFWQDNNSKIEMVNIYKEHIQKLQELVPELKIASAIIHFDESSPHVHVVGVPVVECSKGLKKQCIKTKVFTQESLTLLQERLREHALIKMREVYDKDLQLNDKQVGRNKDIPINVLDDYYNMLNNTKSLDALAKELIKEIESNEQQLDNIDKALVDAQSKLDAQLKSIENNKIVDSALIKSIDDNKKLVADLKKQSETIELANKSKLQDIAKYNEIRTKLNIIDEALKEPIEVKRFAFNKNKVVVDKEYVPLLQIGAELERRSELLVEKQQDIEKFKTEVKEQGRLMLDNANKQAQELILDAQRKADSLDNRIKIIKKDAQIKRLERENQAFKESIGAKQAQELLKSKNLYQEHSDNERCR